MNVGTVINSGLKFEVLDYEMVHWADEDMFIAHKANIITYSNKGNNYKIEMPTDELGWKRVGMPFRKLRRLLRLDKAMITPVDNGLVLFRYGRIYKYDLEKAAWIKSNFKMNCRNPMYNAVLNVEGIIYAGEYGNKNGIGKRIIRSVDHGYTWNVVYQFQPDEIRHIHALMWDEYSSKIWIFTGDDDKDCRVLIADKNFNEVKEVGSGGQEWRACHALFTEETVSWGMDSPLKEVHHITYDRKTGEITKGFIFAGPVWFARQYKDFTLAASAQEIGPSHKDKKLHMYMSKDLNQWKEILTFEHDGWPKGYFRFGTITLAKANIPLLCFEGVENLDGKTVKVTIC